MCKIENNSSIFYTHDVPEYLILLFPKISPH